MASIESLNSFTQLAPVNVVSSSNQSGVYYNGPLNNGIRSTFTCTSGILTIDSVTVLLGDFVLLIGQTNTWENGIYQCTQQGAVGVSAILQRRGDFQCIEQMKAGQFIPVQAGAIHSGDVFTIVAPIPSAVGASGSGGINFMPVAPGGGGTVSPGLINQLALYAANGSTVSGLATVNNAALTTNALGVPTWRAMTDGQLIIGSSAGAPLAGTITAGTNISIVNGHNSITISSSNGITPAALTEVNDTNVTLTLGGTPATSLLQAVSITAGWTGQLAVGRGGTGNSTFTAYSVLCAGTTSTGAFQNVSGVGTSGQVLTSNGAAALPTWQNSAGVTSAQIQNQAFTSAVDSGSANALAITLSPAPAAYVEGQLFTVRAANNNTSTTTLNVNGLGAKGVFTANGNACIGGEIVGGTTYLFEYNGAVNAFNIINPSNLTVNQAPQIQNQKFVYAVDSGAANAYVVTLSPAPGAYADGMVVSFRATNANSGASTINVNSLGVKSIVDNSNSALASGAILVNGTYDLIYNSSFGKFVLVNSSASGGGVTAAQIQQQAFTYAIDSGATNAYGVTLSPAPSAYTDGMYVCFVPSNSNSGASTLNVNGLGAVTLVGMNFGSALPAGFIVANSPIACVYNLSSNVFYTIPFLSKATALFAESTSGAYGGGASASNSADPHCLTWGASSSTFGSGNSSYDLAFGTSVVLTGSLNATTYCFGFGNSINLNTSGFFQTASYCFTFGNGITIGAKNYCFAFGQTITVNNSGSWVIGDSNASPNQDSAANQFNATFANGYRFFINNTPTLALSIDSSGNVINSRGEADLSKTITSPSTGGTVTLATTNRRTLIDPSGTLATLTVNMPASPVDGQIQAFSFTQIITALTISGNGNTIKGNLGSAAIGSSFTFIYNAGTTTWYPTD